MTPRRQHTHDAPACHAGGHELNSVTLACREAGISRTVFYRWRTRFERYGTDGLHPRRHHARRGRPRQIAPHFERLILSARFSRRRRRT